MLPNGSSLEGFRAACRLTENVKMSFPFHRLEEDLSLLDQAELPPLASQWTSELTGETPSQESVDAARQFCRDRGFDVRAYLKFYLRQDCEMLIRGVDVLRQTYFNLLNICFVDVGKYSVSSLAAMGAQRHLFKNKRVGMFSTDDYRVYSLLRQGLKGGLTALSRTAGGMDTSYTDFIWLHRQQAAYEGREELRTDEEIELAMRGLNGHRLPPSDGTGLESDPGPRLDNYVQYLDMTGMYSNAGK